MLVQTRNAPAAGTAPRRLDPLFYTEVVEVPCARPRVALMDDRGWSIYGAERA